MFWWRHVFYIRAARGEANWMWMEGDGVDGGGNLLNATPSSFFFFAGAPCLVWTIPRVCAVPAMVMYFAGCLHQQKSPNSFILIFLIAVFLDIYILVSHHKVQRYEMYHYPSTWQSIIEWRKCSLNSWHHRRTTLTLAVFG